MRSRIRAATSAVYRRARALPLAGASLVGALQPAAWYQYGVGITVTGAGVSVWADQSGNGRNLLQGTDTNRPALQANGSILFDGADNFLQTAGFTLNQPTTWYLMFKQVTVTTNDRIFDGVAAATLLAQTGTNQDITLNLGSTITNTAMALNTYAPIVAVMNGASSVIQVSTTIVSGNAGANNPGGITLGGNRSGVANFSNIEAREMIAFAAAHDEATRAEVIAYLSRVGA